ncbi:MAG TPA: hypothetical protein VGC74_09745 [Stenotrophomonas sp.]
MRGRYTVSGNTVAWFGVSMISTWQNQAGQVLESTMTVGMDFRHGGNAPKVTFTPTVNITDANAPLPQSAADAVKTAVVAAPAPAAPAEQADTQVAATTQVAPQSPAPAGTDTTATPQVAATPAQPQRGTDASGLQNVSGLVQSVQVAGDRNVASNATSLTVRNGAIPDAAQSAVQGATGGTTSTTNGAATASASYANGTAGVLLLIAGQGEVQQWIRNGSVGQSIQLTGDAQHVSNRLQLDLVRQTLSDNAPLTQNVAQAISLARGMGPMGQ